MLDITSSYGIGKTSRSPRTYLKVCSWATRGFSKARILLEIDYQIFKGTKDGFNNRSCSSLIV